MDMTGGRLILLSVGKKPKKKKLSSPLVIEPVHPGSSSILLVQEHPVELIAERENNSFVVIETHQKNIAMHPCSRAMFS